jgi:hypothetical protein
MVYDLTIFFNLLHEHRLFFPCWRLGGKVKIITEEIKVALRRLWFRIYDGLFWWVREIEFFMVL